MKQEIAKALEDSGLFGGFRPNKGHCPGGSMFAATPPPWPNADQSEKILSDLGLQVVWFEGFWHLTTLKRASALIVMLDGGYYIGDIPKGHRTHANNAALAYCCENKFDELKSVMEK
jgi:hypothetical protein